MSGLHTIGTWVRDRAVLTPERVAVDFQGRLTSYAELERASTSRAAEMIRRGLVRGDRVEPVEGNHEPRGGDDDVLGEPSVAAESRSSPLPLALAEVLGPGAARGAAAASQFPSSNTHLSGPS